MPQDPVKKKESKSGSQATIAKTDPLVEAVQFSQQQEMHDATIQKMQSDTILAQNKQLQAERKQEGDLQRDMAKVKADGGITFPDPEAREQEPMREAVNPFKDGSIDSLIRSGGINLNQEGRATDAFRDRFHATNTARQNDAMFRELTRNMLIESAQKLDDERSLDHAPAGGFGRLFGKILNVGSNIATLGNYSLGTEIFGGSLPESHKLQLLSRMAASTSPLIKGEFGYQTNKGKGEITGRQRLGAVNLPTWLAPPGASGESVDEDIKIALEIPTVLASDTALSKTFGSEPENNIKDSFSAFQNIEQSKRQLDELLSIADPTQEHINLLEHIQKKLSNDREQFNQMVVEYAVNQGGTPEALQDIVKQMDTVIFDNFIQPSLGNVDPTETKHVSVAKARRAVIGNISRKQASNFLDSATALMLGGAKGTIFKGRHGVTEQQAAEFEGKIKGIKSKSAKGTPALPSRGPDVFSLEDVPRGGEKTPISGADIANIINLAADFKTDKPIVKALSDIDVSSGEFAKLKMLMLEAFDEGNGSKEDRARLRKLLIRIQNEPRRK